jgi:hypothetical protein
MKILVASHRRSGTHLTIDSIINNSAKEFRLANFDKIRSEQPINLDNNVVYKTHCNGKKFLDSYCNLNFDKIIYVYRDGRDVMKSLLKYEGESVDFYEFINKPNKYEIDEYEKELTKMECWGYHINSWMNRDVFYLKFGDIVDNYEGVIEELFDYLEVTRVNITQDIRQSSRLKYYIDKYLLRKDITTVKFRGGKKGGYEQYFDKRSLKLFNEILKQYDLNNFIADL